MTPPHYENNPDNNHWDIDEFALKANEALSDKVDTGSSKSSDSRLTSKMTARNLRRLVSQGAIEPPSRSGREAYFGPKHLEQMLAARELMEQGFTSSSIQALRNAKSPDGADQTKLSHDNSVHAPQLSSVYSVTPSLASRPLNMLDATDHKKAFFTSTPTTADALLFLSKVNPPTTAPSMLGLDSSNRLVASTLQSSFDARSTEARLATAYQALGSHKPLASALTVTSPISSKITSTLEAEPFTGLRITIEPHSGMRPLDTQQKMALLECIEHLWAAATAAGHKPPNL